MIGTGVVEQIRSDVKEIDQSAVVTELVRVELSFFVHPSELPEVEQMIDSMLEFSGAEVERWTPSGS